MPLSRSHHCVYDTHYHIVCPVKYRKALLSREVVGVIRSTMKGLEERYDLTFEQAGDDQDHIHLLLTFHPKYSIGEIVRIFKSLTARELFRQLPELKRELWGGEFWSDGYYAATIGTRGTWAIVERYVKNQGKNLKDLQLTLW